MKRRSRQRREEDEKDNNEQDIRRSQEKDKYVLCSFPWRSVLTKQDKK